MASKGRHTETVADPFNLGLELEGFAGKPNDAEGGQAAASSTDEEKAAESAEDLAAEVFEHLAYHGTPMDKGTFSVLKEVVLTIVGTLATTFAGKAMSKAVSKTARDLCDKIKSLTLGAEACFDLMKRCAGYGQGLLQLFERQGDSSADLEVSPHAAVPVFCGIGVHVGNALAVFKATNFRLFFFF